MSTEIHDCPFCQIWERRAPATVLARTESTIIIEPLDPVVDGHVLVIPRKHVPDAIWQPEVTASTMRDAALWVKAQQTQQADPRYSSVNVITSVGEAATQTVFHLHLHVVPRAPRDGLPLPWTPLVGERVWTERPTFGCKEPGCVLPEHGGDHHYRERLSCGAYVCEAEERYGPHQHTQWGIKILAKEGN